MEAASQKAGVFFFLSFFFPFILFRREIVTDLARHPRPPEEGMVKDWRAGSDLSVVGLLVGRFDAIGSEDRGAQTEYPFSFFSR